MILVPGNYHAFIITWWRKTRASQHQKGRSCSVPYGLWTFCFFLERFPNHTLAGTAVWMLNDLSSVLSLSCVQLFETPWTAACQASLFFTSSWSLLKLMSIESVMPSKHLILCCPLLLLPSIFPGLRVFSNESALQIRWPKFWSFSFSISPSNDYSGLISFRIKWFDFVVQGTLKSLLRHHSSKA